jgi:hypothetical protein
MHGSVAVAVIVMASRAGGALERSRSPAWTKFPSSFQTQSCSSRPETDSKSLPVSAHITIKVAANARLHVPRLCRSRSHVSTCSPVASKRCSLSTRRQRWACFSTSPTGNRSHPSCAHSSTVCASSRHPEGTARKGPTAPAPQLIAEGSKRSWLGNCPPKSCWKFSELMVARGGIEPPTRGFSVR